MKENQLIKMFRMNNDLGEVLKFREELACAGDSIVDATVSLAC